MTVSAFALAAADVINGAIVLVRANPPGYLIPAQRLANTPSDIVIGAGGIARNSEATDVALMIIESEPATENIHAADPVAHHRVLPGAEVVGFSAIGQG